MELQGRSVLVTGGASGLGAATARRMAALGAFVVIADLDLEGEALAAALGGNAAFVPTDVTDPEAVAAALHQAQARAPLAVLVNCAGIALAEKILGREGPHDLEAFARVVQVNLVGTFNALRLAAWAMKDNPPNADGERGVIINTASVAAFEGQVGQAAYSAAKGGVAALTLPAARELARHGIRVVTIAPGIFDTPMLHGLPEPARAALAQQVPFPARLGRPEEYAALVAHIVENPMLNGAVIRLDGALRLPPR
ncbi:3-hydroxyacyl-CoA dehydrogenase [Marinithermus hydrothermalis]|uniref:3-hydroxy-2-methylbutyryl-CoA dehydrogenase n=1 Tax=Marinithermus hydrothermalis (strain DSM 14884 / JCM 11576 / T1) TaxID=869210 RepID=F2NKP4_MARHT|nr:3-hydroxyacyl-CoA dehydrogenase [Marinithermus hydrothermalis]AEB10807.1 3-hydroxy-2-methylbutyryl-CoA dehydrogenase [Marinithermus hydrothermalis DSM 14884]